MTRVSHRTSGNDVVVSVEKGEDGQLSSDLLDTLLVAINLAALPVFVLLCVSVVAGWGPLSDMPQDIPRTPSVGSESAGHRNVTLAAVGRSKFDNVTVDGDNSASVTTKLNSLQGSTTHAQIAGQKESVLLPKKAKAGEDHGTEEDPATTPVISTTPRSEKRDHKANTATSQGHLIPAFVPRLFVPRLAPQKKAKAGEDHGTEEDAATTPVVSTTPRSEKRDHKANTATSQGHLIPAFVPRLFVPRLAPQKKAKAGEDHGTEEDAATTPVISTTPRSEKRDHKANTATSQGHLIPGFEPRLFHQPRASKKQ